jgi:uncharacterized protein YcbX
MSSAHVAEIHVYPVKGEPGQDLQVAQVEADGLAGDRRKKAAVQVVAQEDVTFSTRANFIVSLPSADLTGAVGSVLRVGEVELDVTGPAGDCPGVYAAVRRPGSVRLGDAVSLREPG